MKTIKITQMIMRAAFVLVLILGIIFWVNRELAASQPIQSIHELLGLIVVISLWIIGLAQGFRKGGSMGLGIASFLVGLVVPIVGIAQLHWSVPTELSNTIHLLLGLLAVGLGEMIAGRSKRLAREQSASASASA